VQDNTFQITDTTDVSAMPEVAAGGAFLDQLTLTLTGPAWALNSKTGWQIDCALPSSSNSFGGSLSAFLVPVSSVPDPTTLYSLSAQVQMSGSIDGVGAQYAGLIHLTAAALVSTTSTTSHAASGCVSVLDYSAASNLTVPAGTPAGEYFVVTERFAKRDWRDCDHSCRGTFTATGTPPTIVVDAAS
jgi:hypothetical protein